MLWSQTNKQKISKNLDKPKKGIIKWKGMVAFTFRNTYFSHTMGIKSVVICLVNWFNVHGQYSFSYSSWAKVIAQTRSWISPRGHNIISPNIYMPEDTKPSIREHYLVFVQALKRCIHIVKGQGEVINDVLFSLVFQERVKLLFSWK